MSMWYVGNKSLILFGSLIVFLLGFATCCATPQSRPEIPPVQSEQPSATDYFQIAFAQYTMELWQGSINSFYEALYTGDLNNSGRAVCYWHIAQAYLHLADADNAAEAFFFFSIVADDIIYPKNRMDFLGNSSNFIESFELYDKLDFAIDYINILWVSKQ